MGRDLFDADSGRAYRRRRKSRKRSDVCSSRRSRAVWRADRSRRPLGRAPRSVAGRRCKAPSHGDRGQGASRAQLTSPVAPDRRRTARLLSPHAKSWRAAPATLALRRMNAPAVLDVARLLPQRRRGPSQRVLRRHFCRRIGPAAAAANDRNRQSRASAPLLTARSLSSSCRRAADERFGDSGCTCRKRWLDDSSAVEKCRAVAPVSRPACRRATPARLQPSTRRRSRGRACAAGCTSPRS